jgi:hypothetical protein
MTLVRDCIAHAPVAIDVEVLNRAGRVAETHVSGVTDSCRLRSLESWAGVFLFRASGGVDSAGDSQCSGTLARSLSPQS